MQPIEQSGEEASPYNLSLLLAFFANVFQLMAMSLLFRYFDLVQSIGGDERDLGLITGVAALGAIGLRLVQGVAVDRFGSEVVWLVSLAIQAVALAWHLAIDDINGPQIYFARTLFQAGVAGYFGAWLSFISLQSPPHRIAEVIGVVGSSGFVGVAIGPAIGDWLFSEYSPFGPGQGAHVRGMIVASISAVVAAMIFAGLASWVGRRRQLEIQRQANCDPPAARCSSESLWNLFRQYQPGWLLAVGAIMGMAIGFPTIYVRPLAENLGVGNIKVFFLTYNLAAFSSRLIFRRLPEQLGLPTTTLIGLGFVAYSFPCYLLVGSQWTLVIPALLAGLGHSFLFPSVIAGCTLSFPPRHRGVANNLILSMYDIGLLVGMPAVGFLVSSADNRMSYTVPLLVMLGIVHAVGIVFFLEKNTLSRDQRHPSSG